LPRWRSRAYSDDNNIDISISSSINGGGGGGVSTGGGSTSGSMRGGSTFGTYFEGRESDRPGGSLPLGAALGSTAAHQSSFTASQVNSGFGAHACTLRK